MEVAVLGGGHGCYAAAADLSERGHAVRFWRRDAAAFAPVIETGRVTLKDRQGRRDIRIAQPTADLAEAVRGAALIVVPLPATAQAGLFPALAPLLADNQVVFLPPGTFGSYALHKAARDAGNRARFAVAETGTLPWLCRKHGPAEVAVSGRTTRLPTGVYPAKESDWAFDILRKAFPAVEPRDDALDGALMNAGPIIHPPLIVMNAGPLEHFPRWDIHKEGTQASIRRVTDALDGERMRLREALGYRAPHFPLADHYAKSGPEWMYGRGSHDKLTDSGDWREHIVLTEHRYMREDTRISLSFFASVAALAGVAMPLAQAFLSIGGAICGGDFMATGRTLASLGLGALDRTPLQALLRVGFA